MPLTADQAKQRVGRLLKESSATRTAQEAYCGLCVAYAYGSQWASTATTRRGGYAAMQLRTIIDADRSDVRVTLNLIRARIQKLHSRLAPEAISTRVSPASRSPNDQVAALVGNGRMKIAMRELGAVGQVVKADLWRLVLGSVVLRRYVWRGQPVVARDAAGRPRVAASGDPVRLPAVSYAWEPAAPYEFIRDAAAYDVDFAGEDCIVHEKPRTLRWLERHFGVRPDDLGENVPTMGKLMELQQFLYNATGSSCDMSTRTDSKEPAVMVGEAWFRDDESDRRRRWPWWGMYYRNQGGAEAADRELRWLPLDGEDLFGPNPYHGLPLHHLYYETEINSPWGKGVPFLLIQAQDMSNLGFTALLRRQQAHGSAKYVYLKDTIEEPHKVLGPDMWTPIPVTTPIGAQSLQRLAPPPLDPAMTAMIQGTPTWFDWLLNMSPVQFGVSPGKHPEAGKAIIIRKDEADTVINQINREDERTVSEALTGTLFDIVRHESTDVLAETLSHEFTHDQILSLKQQDIARSVIGVEVTPNSLRPRTRQEVREEASQDLTLKLTDPVTARRTMYVTEGVRIDEKECRAIAFQAQEIATLLDGRESPVLLDQDHDAHIWRIALEAESPRAQGYSDEQLDALMAHAREHEDAKLIKAQLAARRQAVLTSATMAEAAPGAGPEAAGPSSDIRQPEGQVAPQLQELRGGQPGFGSELPRPPEGAEAPEAELAVAV